jgi:hypothetical protein
LLRSVLKFIFSEPLSEGLAVWWTSWPLRMHTVSAALIRIQYYQFFILLLMCRTTLMMGLPLFHRYIGKVCIFT